MVDLFDAMEKKYEDKLTNVGFIERYDEIEKLSDMWIEENDAYVHSFWSDDDGGSSFAIADAYYDAIKIGKEKNKNIVVLEYNS